MHCSRRGESVFSHCCDLRENPLKAGLLYQWCTRLAEPVELQPMNGEHRRFAGINSLKGRPGMSDVSPLSGISGLSFDSTLLSPLLFFCLVLLPFLSYRFLHAGPFF